ncbi:hexosaminidase [Arachidicoccus rhizosphaerae]|uniref:beta-N-acetylhexosaminidase n=2 Tax=Arachidicoccus rhizosphaerae TaxID=551991 RepID=A0A1H4AFW9_9BACT|nr:hexosaminidase [Arachidicoccus rhizosphaerae]
MKQSLIRPGKNYLFSKRGHLNINRPGQALRAGMLCILMAVLGPQSITSLFAAPGVDTAAGSVITQEAPRIIPEPAYLSMPGNNGSASYRLDPAATVHFQMTKSLKKLSKQEAASLKDRLRVMQQELQTALGTAAGAAGESRLRKQAAKTAQVRQAAVLLELNPDLDFKQLTAVNNEAPKASLLSEAYRLHIDPQGVKISARSSTGLYYGLQSLLQLIDQYKYTQAAGRTAATSVEQSTDIVLPLLEVQDAPAYSWRGFMLDVSRHFYTAAEIKKLLDVMSRYKLNIFHWHLTDDQGWRLQIRRYPKLTSVGAWREEIPGSVFFNKRPDTLTGTPYRYGGFYTQKEAREIVRYAALRGITVIPEIELPGHAAAALAAYPAYSSSGKAQSVPNSMGYQKGAVSEYNPGNPATFTFLENILTEIMDIFPSTYIHIGGDEVDKTNWKQNASCKRLMQKEGLKDYEALQSYFINKIGRFLEQHGRKIIGWDEALEGNLLPSATITYWRSYAKKAPLKAVSEGHGFINVCSDPLYFNRYQAGPAGEPLAAPHSMNTLEKVYQYQIMPDGLTKEQQSLVKGGQAAIWTEFFSDPEGMEYMLLPRLLALSENLWTQEKNKDYPAFYQALPRELTLLGRLGYHYRKLDK